MKIESWEVSVDQIEETRLASKASTNKDKSTKMVMFISVAKWIL